MTPACISSHDAVGHHLGVDAQVLVVEQEAEHRFRNAADAGLDGGAIGNQGGHVARDGAVQVGDLVLRIFARAGARSRRTRRRG